MAYSLLWVSLVPLSLCHMHVLVHQANYPVQLPLHFLYPNPVSHSIAPLRTMIANVGITLDTDTPVAPLYHQSPMSDPMLTKYMCNRSSQVTLFTLTVLSVHVYNAALHPHRQIRQIAPSILAHRRYGFLYL